MLSAAFASLVYGTRPTFVSSPRICACPGGQVFRRGVPRASVSNGRDDNGPDARWTPISEAAPWDDIDLSSDLSDEDAEALRAKLPRPIANFLIRRAGGTRRTDTLVSKLVRDGEPEPPEWDDFVYDSRPAPPGVDVDPVFDGIPTEGGVDIKPQSLFLGKESEKEMQARQVGYAALALVLLVALFKIVAAFLAFFVSFTFSFIAIFALSAGLFVVFVLFRFF